MRLEGEGEVEGGRQRWDGQPRHQSQLTSGGGGGSRTQMGREREGELHTLWSLSEIKKNYRFLSNKLPAEPTLFGY